MSVSVGMTGRRSEIRDYAAIGDGRTIALVASNGAIDWLCLPDLDSPSVFASLLDDREGGHFELAPVVPFTAERRYLPDTNVLETTFETADGAIRVTDAMTLPHPGLAPQRELVRRVEGLSGEVPVHWAIEPRFGYATRVTRIDSHAGLSVASAGSDTLGICTWGAGEAQRDAYVIHGSFVARDGERALLALTASHGEPLVFPSRVEAEARLDTTAQFWHSWAENRSYDGAWRDAVIRSALVLKLLVYAPSGAIAAAATTSLPEVIGGERNWDYRFSWIRDSAFTLDAFLALGCPAEAHAYFSWLMHATQVSHPHLRVLYRLGGGTRCKERELGLAGYRDSRPVRVGNAAAPQRQLDVYGELMRTAHKYAQHAGALDRDVGRRLAGIADEVCELWAQPDAGIWEARAAPEHFTQSKMMCWVALDCATKLAAEGRLPARHADRWRATAEEIAGFVETRCWSDHRHSYVRAADTDELDASLLLAAVMGYRPPEDTRLDVTLDAVRRELAAGPLLYRYRADDGLEGREGAFVACSFWLVDALAHRGRVGEAAELMDELVALANDVGLYSEEIDVATGEFLGNFPQGLVHLALINAAATLDEANRR